MSCDRSQGVLHAYFDNELDAVSISEFELHLEHCSECIDALDRMQSLRSSLNAAQLYENAPVSVRKEIRADLAPARTHVHWRWLAIAAALLLCLYTGWLASSFHSASGGETTLTAELIDAHLRSLQPGHLTDVVSSDQHTVKPWFAGKLDFSPPVRDLTVNGFPLQGGRLEVFHGRTSAALVYGRRKHIISVFTWPVREQDSSPHSGSKQGYQWIAWRHGGMEFCAVSDASAGELQTLQGLLIE